MKNLSVDTHPHDESKDQELYDLLKEGEDPGESPGDVGESTVGAHPAHYKEPEDRSSGDMDAPWGEAPKVHPNKHHHVVHLSDSALDAVRQSREDLLDKLFDGRDSTDKTEQALMSQHFKHVSSGEFTTSSPQLSEKAKHSMPETLMEKIRRVTGRH